MNIDPKLCAALLCRITDEIANNRPRAASNGSIGEQIGRVRSISLSASQTLQNELKEHYPAIGWSEEGKQDGSHIDGEHWLYDAIDGAYHFLQGLPLWSSSLTLIRGGHAVFAAVYEPVLGELFVAVDGEGATLNGQPIQVSPKAELRAAVLGAAIPPLAQVGAKDHGEALALLQSISPNIFVVRPMAATSLQLAYVAAGKLDGYWENGRDIGDWIAGSLLIREAGGVVSDLRGTRFGWDCDGILTSNLPIHGALLPLIANARAQLAPIH